MPTDPTYPPGYPQLHQDGSFDIQGALSIGGVSMYAIDKIARVALAAVDTAGGVFAWANPEAVTIIITKVMVYVTTVATGACQLDIGTTATSAATLSDILLDGIDVHAATGLLALANQGGVNGIAQQTLASGKWVTASTATGASAGLVGFAYIHYHII